MPNVDPYKNFKFKVQIESTRSASGHVLNARIAAVELLPPGATMRTGMKLPAVQRVKVAAGDINMDGLRAPGRDPATVLLLLPAVEKVREAAKRSLKFEPVSMSPGARPHKVEPSGSGWLTYILPYVEQENIYKLQNLVRAGGGGALALVQSSITDGTSNTMFRSLIGATDLFEWIKIKSADGGFSAHLEDAIVRVDQDSGKLPVLLIGFSASRKV